MSEISSQQLLCYINEIIKNNEFNYDYIDDIIDYLSLYQSHEFDYNKILTLIYSNIKLFEVVFINFYNERLYIPGEVFNNDDSKILIDIIKKNPNIKYININLCMYITKESLSFLYVLNELKNIKFEFKILYVYIHELFNNINFQLFINNNIIYKLNIDDFNYMPNDYQYYIYNLISNNKINHLNFNRISFKIDQQNLINAITLSTSLKSIYIFEFTINNELYLIFKEHNLLSSFIHYEVLYDYETYHMFINSQLNDDNLCDLIQENEQKNIFNYLKIWDRPLNYTFYNSLKNNTSISKIMFKKITIDCKLLSDLLLNNNTINNIIFEDCNLYNFNYMSDVFKYNKSLTDLKIYNTSLLNYSSTEIFESLKNNTVLTHLDINDKSLTNEDIKNLSECLKYNTTLCDLRIIHYKYNPFIKEICNILQYNTTLTSINFNYCTQYSYLNHKYLDISIEETKQLAEALKNNTSLVSLNLKRLKTEYITPIIEALKVNKFLTSFETPTCIISQELLNKRIIDMLKYNTTLTKLDYW